MKILYSKQMNMGYADVVACIKNYDCRRGSNIHVGTKEKLQRLQEKRQDIFKAMVLIQKFFLNL